MKAILPLLLLALLAGQAFAQGATRDSSYKGGPGSGKSFKEAKIGLLDQYSKVKGVKYTVVKESLGDSTYSVTYSFPTKEALADFQTWQYKQPSFGAKLEKFSEKPKGTSGRKLAL